MQVLQIEVIIEVHFSFSLVLESNTSIESDSHMWNRFFSTPTD